jgi:hypothetical protein
MKLLELFQKQKERVSELKKNNELETNGKNKNIKDYIEAKMDLSQVTDLEVT